MSPCPGHLSRVGAAGKLKGGFRQPGRGTRCAARVRRNFQVMPGAEWLGLLCKHIPDRYEHLVRYCGWYS